MSMAFPIRVVAASRLLLGTVAVVLLVGCASKSPGSTSSAPRASEAEIVTESDETAVRKRADPSSNWRWAITSKARPPSRSTRSSRR